MADGVKWIKLMVGMFDGNSFKKIKRANIGGVSYRDKLTAVWFELLDLAGKSNANGFLIDENEIPYHSYEDIATMIDRDTEEVALCMQFFENAKMVEIIDDVYCLSNWNKYQNEEGLAKIREQNRIRQARWRERQKELSPSQNENNKANNETSNENNDKNNVTERYGITSTSYSTSYTSTSSNSLNLLSYDKVIEIAKVECPICYTRYQRKIDGGKLEYANKLYQILEDIQGQYDYEAIRQLFRHANKTYVVSPNYQQLDVIWVLSNIEKVKAIEEKENSTNLPNQYESTKQVTRKTAAEIQAIWGDINLEDI